MQTKLFINMSPWDDKGSRVIEPRLDGVDRHFDMRNNCRIESIKILDGNLVFLFNGRSYNPLNIEKLSAPRKFSLIFRRVTDIAVSPEDFLPHSGISEMMDDFVFIADDNNKGAQVIWFGDSNSDAEDARIAFHTDGVEFVEEQYEWPDIRPNE